ncbi:hypothetical protein [Absidia glauca]|uniref:SWIM-type domain-containing protein n=1 Tax=Absidia glauca TaxID=4829 RepID=A0A163LRS7_ABSGL|nr:hypothetical protein [Absidia glauca]
MVVYRSETSTFESRFMKEWIKGRGAQVSGTTYSTDLVRWVCGCQFFLHSPVTLCKHLVKAYIAATHDDLVNRKYFIQRSHTPPFINFLPTTSPNTHHPGNHPREGLRPRPSLRRRLSEVGGVTEQPDLHIPRRRNNQPAPAQQQPFVIPELVIPARRRQRQNEATTNTNIDVDATNNAIPVVDEERDFLAHEVRYRDKRANASRLRELLARAEEEEEEEKGQYMTLLNHSNPPQAAVFARAIEEGNEDAYIEAVIRERQRTTLPRTWRDDNPYTRNI